MWGSARPRILSRGVMETPVWADTAYLAWDANTETDVNGYRVYHGTVSGVYSDSKDVGNVMTGSFTVSTRGTHYWALTALDSEGLESGFSNEISGTFT